MTIKCKLSDIAKDLNLTSKEIADFLGDAIGGEARKAGTILTEQELDVIFEHYTSERQVADFDAYFATRSQQPAAGKKPAQKED